MFNKVSGVYIGNIALLDGIKSSFNEHLEETGAPTRTITVYASWTPYLSWQCIHSAPDQLKPLDRGTNESKECQHFRQVP